MMFADRAQAIHEVIAPALELGKLVICDRFTDSTEAYQGGGRELGSEVVRALHRLLCGDLQPDLTLLLLSSLDASLRRARRRNDMAVEQTGTDENRFESEKDPFFKRVQRKYREIASRDKARVVQIDGDLTIEQVPPAGGGCLDATAQAIQIPQLNVAQRASSSAHSAPGYGRKLRELAERITSTLRCQN